MFTTQLLVPPSGQALMQAPEDQVSFGTLRPSSLDSLLESPLQSPSASAQFAAQSASDKTAHYGSFHYRSRQYQWLKEGEGRLETSPSKAHSFWQWKTSSAIAGTAVVSAGLAAIPFSGENSIHLPVGESLVGASDAGADTQLLGQGDDMLSLSQALDQGASQGLSMSPQIAQPEQVGFSQLDNSSFKRSQDNFTLTPVVAQPTGHQKPVLTRLKDGSWGLAYDTLNVSASAVSANEASITSINGVIPQAGQQANWQNVADPAIATQEIVSRLAQEAVARTETVCLDNSCQGLKYVQSQLPKAEQAAQAAQTKLTEFEAQHGKGDMATYQSVLSDRLSEVSSEKSKTAVELAETRRYIGQLKIRLTTVGVTAELPEHLLRVDADYQAAWSQLKQTERQLLEEYTQANVSAGELNRIYSNYERHQAALFASAQAVLGNYILSSEAAGPASALVGSLRQSPAALDLLQSLVVATHQEDLQQLRQETMSLSESRLRSRHRTLAATISEYELLQRNLVDAQALVSQYESRRDRIATEAAKAAPLLADASKNSGNNAVTSAVTSALGSNFSSAFDAAAALEPYTAEDSIGKVILGIVVAAGAVAVAVQRRAGDVSEALALELLPNSRSQFGFPAMASSVASSMASSVSSGVIGTGKRLANPVAPGLLSELLDLTGPRQPVFASIGPLVNQVNSPEPRMGRRLSQPGTPEKSLEKSLESQWMAESMSRELKTIVGQATPEGQFASEVRDRTQNGGVASAAANAMEPVRLPVEYLDAFAESAVRWVLKDLSNTAVPEKLVQATAEVAPAV